MTSVTPTCLAYQEPQEPQALPEVKQEASGPPQLRLRGQRYFVRSFTVLGTNLDPFP